MSIENAKNSIKKIIFGKDLVDEFLNLRNDKVFEFCRKNSDLEFTQEEFEYAVKELLVSAFPEEFGMDTTNDKDLEKVAGGKNNLTTKLTASALALMSVSGGLFTKNETPFSTPSAKAGLFSSKYVVPNPWEVDEIIEAVFRSEYCKGGLNFIKEKVAGKKNSLTQEKIGLNNRIKDVTDTLSNHKNHAKYLEIDSDTKKKNTYIISGRNVKSDGDGNALADVKLGANRETLEKESIYIGVWGSKLKTDEIELNNDPNNIEDAKEMRAIWYAHRAYTTFLNKCTASIKQFNSHISKIDVEIIALNQRIESLNEREKSGCKGWKDAGFGESTLEQFKEKWKTNNFELGKKWWEGFIKSGLYYAPNFEKPGIAEKFGKAFAKAMNEASNDDSDEVDADIDLLAIEELLTIYHTKLFELNGYSKDVSLSAISGLTGSDEYKKSLDNFGVFSVWTKKDGRPMRYVQSGKDYSHHIVKILCDDSGKRNMDYTLSKLVKVAPWIAVGAVAYFGSGAFRSLFSMAGPTVDKIKNAGRKAWRRFVYNRLSLEKDPVKLKELMSEYLKSSVMCQDKAIDKMVEIMSGMADLWNESDRTGKDCTSACTMTFMGDSGIGKTFAARNLSKALFHKDMQPWQFITSTSVTASSTGGSASSDSNKNTKNKDNNNTSNEKLSPADQLFNENSELVRQLRLNNRVIIVLDEIDKMHKADPDDTILERLRDARDTGKLLVRKGVNYEYIDVSRTVFICITNERRECWGLPEENLTEDQAASRTYIKRDRSLTNRFDVVEFDYFTSEGYQTILKPQLEEMSDEYYNNYKINFNITDELIKNIGDAAERKNKGVRGVNDYLIALRGKLVDYRSKNKIFRKNKNVVDLSIIYDSYTNSFEILNSEEEEN